MLWSNTDSSRKFVDLIKKSSSKWANWTPPNLIEVGDYGRINKKSGAFQREGNIYHEPSLKYITDQFPKQRCEPMDEFIASSSNVKQCVFGMGADIGVYDIAETSFKAQWQFDSSRGALLVMIKPRMTVLPNELLNACIGNELLERKTVVVEVFSCPAYAMYLSNKKITTVGLALKVDTSDVAAAQLDTLWRSNITSGMFQKAYRREERYTPLFDIREVRKADKRRDSTGQDNRKVDRWDDVEVPWGDLDEDGQEEVDESSDESGSDL
ncbi:hypothetical protein ACEPAH_9479 [Sanghuangporus vaninii]